VRPAGAQCQAPAADLSARRRAPHALRTRQAGPCTAGTRRGGGAAVGRAPQCACSSLPAARLPSLGKRREWCWQARAWRARCGVLHRRLCSPQTPPCCRRRTEAAGHRVCAGTLCSLVPILTRTLLCCRRWRANIQPGPARLPCHCLGAAAHAATLTLAAHHQAGMAASYAGSKVCGYVCGCRALQRARARAALDARAACSRASTPVRSSNLVYGRLALGRACSAPAESKL